MSIKNDRLLKVLRGEPVDRTPVWVMRQAGRYLPEYRKTRAQAGDFLKLCQTPELACEVTLQPLARFPLDAAILFADILLIPHAMDVGLHFLPGEGPKIERPIRSWEAAKALPIPDPEADLGYVMEAVRTIKQALDSSIPLLGFCGSPWTVATYMVEGGGTKDFRQIKRMLYAEPDLLHHLLNTLTEASILYLKAQIAAGADAVMIFDTWGGVLGAPQYEAFSLAYMRKIIASLKEYAPEVPVLLFTKQGGPYLEAMAATGAQGLGVDWTMPLSEARARVGENIALQGNMDPSALYADPKEIDQTVAQLLENYGHGHRHILNLGHGIHQDIDPQSVQAFVEAAAKHSPQYHR